MRVQPLSITPMREHSEVKEFMVIFWRNCLLRSGAWLQTQGGVLTTRRTTRTSKAEYYMAGEYARVWNRLHSSVLWTGFTSGSDVREFRDIVTQGIYRCFSTPCSREYGGQSD